MDGITFQTRTETRTIRGTQGDGISDRLAWVLAFWVDSDHLGDGKPLGGQLAHAKGVFRGMGNPLNSIRDLLP
jgi:hypothetical protein